MHLQLVKQGSRVRFGHGQCPMGFAGGLACVQRCSASRRLRANSELETADAGKMPTLLAAGKTSASLLVGKMPALPAARLSTSPISSRPLIGLAM